MDNFIHIQIDSLKGHKKFSSAQRQATKAVLKQYPQNKIIIHGRVESNNEDKIYTFKYQII